MEPGRAAPPWQSIEVQVGRRSYGDLEPVEDQTPVGLAYLMERPGDDFGWEIGGTFATEDGTQSGTGGDEKVSADVYELYAALRRTFDTSGPLRPYLGLGLTLIQVDARISGASGSRSDSDLTTGAFLRGGLRVDFGPRVHVALDARRAFWTGLDVAGQGWDANHDQLALILGFSF